MASPVATFPKTLLLNKPNTPSSLKNQKLRNPRSTFLKISAIAQKWEPSKVVPQADRVLVRLEQLHQKSPGGVLLPKAAVKFERYLVGEIISVGADVANVDAGKKVIFSDMNAYKADLGSESRHCFVRSSDLLAVVE